MPYNSDLLKVKQTEYSLTAGRILISVPYYNDAFFNRSVVLLTDYDQQHCAGLIVNHRLPFPVRDLVDELPIDAPMHLGGPVMPTALFLLHNANLRYKFLMGYAGWAPGQLEGELRRNMWVIGNPTSDLVFRTEPEKVWEQAVRILGPEYKHWLQVPKFINLN